MSLQLEELESPERVARGTAEPWKLQADERSGARCSECHRLIRATGGWYVDDDGVVQPYCRACAGIEFPLI